MKNLKDRKEGYLKMVKAIAKKLDSYMDKQLTGNTMNYKQVLSIFIPILIDQAFIVGLSMLNTIMISSSGVAAVSAVGMVDTINIFLLNVFIAIATGGTVVVAQYKGNGNEEMVKKSIEQTISAVGLIAFVISAIVIIFHNPILNILFGEAEKAVLDNARIYLIGSCISFTFIAIVEAVCGVLRGIAQSKPSMMLSLVMNILYVILNLIFIVVFDMGIMGMVISLIVSRAIAMFISIIYIVSDKNLQIRFLDIIKIDLNIQRKVLYIGIPCAAEQLFFNGGKLLTQTFIVQLGTYAIAVNTISNVITNLFQIVANSLCLAIVTVVGQCIGHGDVEDARKYIKSFLKITAISYIIVVGILLPFYPFIVQLFSPPQEIVGTIFIVVAITGVFAPFLWPASFVIPSALRAAGDSKFPFVVSLLTMWLFRVVLGYVLGIVLPFGITGVWIAMIAEWAIRSMIFYKRYQGTKWYQHQLIEK